jgi:hypothetical protein
MLKLRILSLAGCLLMIGAIQPLSAQAANSATSLDQVSITASQNDIFNAGHPVPPLGDGFPVKVTLPASSAGKAIEVSDASGGVSQGVNPPSSTPDGGYDPDLAMNINSYHGISGVVADPGLGGFLAGVFTSDAEPTGTGPARLDYTAATGKMTTTQSSYQPAVDQLFFIGDGLTGTGTGQQQQFIVPDGATTLWLGVADAGYYQGDPIPTTGNTGGFTATLSLSSAIAYVALGDSFSSGEGNPPYDTGTDVPTDKCHRSPEAYPHLLASRDPSQWNLGPQDFVACSGSTVQNVVYGQTSATHREGTQLDKLNNNTARVTISIGGNDIDFSSVIQDCIYGVLFPTIHGSRDCADKVFTGDNSTNGMTLDAYEQSLITGLGNSRPCTTPKGDAPAQCSGQVPSLAGLYELIQQDAPNAAIYVMLYPYLFNHNPGPARCDLYGAGPSHIFISQANQKFINNGVDALDKEIVQQIQVAQAAGVDVTGVDPRSQYATPNGQGHGVCSDQPWINGIHLTHNGNHVAKAAPESFHPNSLGQAAFADAFQLSVESTGR